ncbi:SDR family NAD(P)-dependent oxidoreductase [Christensenella tenuis]|uniref:3-oxoacyl-ACP reductase FabG n=1 Tax=Christensenella tenuis TaxID=2763033 RepID=A0ABR7EG12_9FIRM|nr:3-oxoacyl-ACP reductase family protein [Christensenella tenuis]MBC5648623.1 3-oxoacyl-ACP reductase FabG [Christensenella tenuis]
MSEQRVAIITGGTRGMGKSMSLALAERGDIVVAVYRSNEQSALEVKEELQKLSPQSDVIQGDVSKKADVDRIVKTVGDRFGRIDILVNNAGIFDFAFLEDMTEDDLDRYMSINFKSQFLMTQAVIPYMKKNKYGRIVNASSISATLADVGLVGYGCSKAAVNMFTKIMAGELAPYDITVNAYAPGIIHTDMTDGMIRERGDVQVKQIALKRFGTGEEAAALVAFLSSPEAGYVTGEIIGVDGGFFKVQNPYRAHEYAETGK